MCGRERKARSPCVFQILIDSVDAVRRRCVFYEVILGDDVGWWGREGGSDVGGVNVKSQGTLSENFQILGVGIARFLYSLPIIRL